MMALDYQSLLYAPIYEVLGQPATIGDLPFTVINKTRPSSFTGFGVDFQAFRPSAIVRMAEILGAGLAPIDDVLGAELVMDGKSWSIKSYEHVPSPNGLDDGELRLFLKDDVNV